MKKINTMKFLAHPQQPEQIGNNRAIGSRREYNNKQL